MKKYGLLLAKVGYCAVVAGLLTGAGVLGSQRLKENGVVVDPLEAVGGGAPGRTARFLDMSDVESSKSPGKAMVYVTGAVKNPGLYEIPLGARAIEAIAAAGGATEKADLERVNLAQRMPDGAHVAVPESTGGRPRVQIRLPKVAVGRVSSLNRDAARGSGKEPTLHEVVAEDTVAYL
ncbi:MAG: SLBB domain-containing protein [Fimbriimonadaceae bacterium]|nr:SLBB domain-containing protein [Fimbriimonadaceae bacterium]